MILTTTESIEGKQVVEVLGLVMANSVKARHVGKDIVAALRNIVGGEVEEDGAGRDCRRPYLQ